MKLVSSHTVQMLCSQCWRHGRHLALAASVALMVKAAVAAGGTAGPPKGSDGLRLDPAEATLRVSASQSFAIKDCVLQPSSRSARDTETDELEPLARPSKDGKRLVRGTVPDELAPLMRMVCRSTQNDRSIVVGACVVNGVPGGDARLGQVSYLADAREVRYTAPANVPKPGTVTVGCQVRNDGKPLNSGGLQYQLLARVTIVDKTDYLGTISAKGCMSSGSSCLVAWSFDPASIVLKLDPSRPGTYEGRSLPVFVTFDITPYYKNEGVTNCKPVVRAARFRVTATVDRSGTGAVRYSFGGLGELSGAMPETVPCSQDGDKVDAPWVFPLSSISIMPTCTPDKLSLTAPNAISLNGTVRNLQCGGLGLEFLQWNLNQTDKP